MTGWRSPYAWIAVGMVAAVYTLDVFLRRRYAAGARGRDANTMFMLVLGLNLTTLVVLLTPAFDVGLVSAKAGAVLGPTGVAMAAVGFALRYSAIFVLGRWFTWRVTILEQHRIVDEGPFRVLRHPSYAGGMLAVVGVSLAFGSWLGLLCFTVVYLPIVLRRIDVEEDVLLAHFGDAYHDYMRRTWRLIPYVY